MEGPAAKVRASSRNTSKQPSLDGLVKSMPMALGGWSKSKTGSRKAYRERRCNCGCGQWHNEVMSFLSDYFSAPSDEEAVRAVTKVLSELPYDVLQTKGLIPEYHLVPVEAFLRGCSVEAVEAGSRHGKVLASVDDGQVMVMTVSDELTASLAAASSEQIADAAESWSHFEDFQGTDTSRLSVVLGDLADLARRAIARGEHLYCKISC